MGIHNTWRQAFAHTWPGLAQPFGSSALAPTAPLNCGAGELVFLWSGIDGSYCGREHGPKMHGRGDPFDATKITTNVATSWGPAVRFPNEEENEDDPVYGLKMGNTYGLYNPLKYARDRWTTIIHARTQVDSGGDGHVLVCHAGDPGVDRKGMVISYFGNTGRIYFYDPTWSTSFYVDAGDMWNGGYGRTILISHKHSPVTHDSYVYIDGVYAGSQNLYTTQHPNNSLYIGYANDWAVQAGGWNGEIMMVAIYNDICGVSTDHSTSVMENLSQNTERFFQPVLNPGFIEHTRTFYAGSDVEPRWSGTPKVEPRWTGKAAVAPRWTGTPKVEGDN